MKVLILNPSVLRKDQHGFMDFAIKQINTTETKRKESPEWHSVRFGFNLVTSLHICAKVKEKIPKAIVFDGYSKETINEVVSALQKEYPLKKLSFFAKGLRTEAIDVVNISSLDEVTGVVSKENSTPELQEVLLSA